MGTWPRRFNKAGNVANLYDLLMISPTATKEQIEKSFRSKAKFYDPEITGDRSNLQIYEELKLAYQTLMDDSKREEYDDYLSSLTYNIDKEKEPDIDPEEVERRRQERGKKRFMEDFEFVNEDFFNQWKERTGASGGPNDYSQTDESAENNMGLNGNDITITVKMDLENVLFEKDEIVKEIKYNKHVICEPCGGNREAEGKEGSKCYSCKGAGIKKDPLFKKVQKCQTCKGFGYLVQNPCTSCSGQGTKIQEFIKEVAIRKFIEHNETLLFKHEGHQTLFQNLNGIHGDLKIHV